jgi:hypothetical protein
MTSYKNVIRPARLLSAFSLDSTSIFNVFTLKNTIVYLASSQYETLALFKPNFYNVILLEHTIGDVLYIVKALRFKEEQSQALGSTILVYHPMPTEPFILSSIYSGATDVVNNKTIMRYVK